MFGRLAEIIERTVLSLLLSRNEKERRGYIDPTPIGRGLSPYLWRFWFYYARDIASIKFTILSKSSMNFMFDISSAMPTEKRKKIVLSSSSFFI